MGKAAEAQFGFCQVCRAGDHEACRTNGCKCRETEEHNDVMNPPEPDELPAGFTWEEPPPQSGRHPLTPQIQVLLKTQPGKAGHIKHFEGKSSAYQVVRNFNAGKYKDLDVGEWDFRHVKDGVHGPGSDLYVAYIGEG
jgi:hypothetical protein